MKQIRTVVLTITLTFLAAVVCWAGPEMGTWKLNEAKSKLAPGIGKNEKVVYKAAGDQVKVTVDGVDAEGKAVHNEWIGKFDGKAYPVKGDRNFDGRAYRQVNDHTLDMTLMHGGKRVGSGKIEVSADGKTRTVTTSGKDANGKNFKSTAVYDKA